MFCEVHPTHAPFAEYTQDAVAISEQLADEWVTGVVVHGAKIATGRGDARLFRAVLSFVWRAKRQRTGTQPPQVGAKPRCDITRLIGLRAHFADESLHER